jgi:hypothetical protein
LYGAADRHAAATAIDAGLAATLRGVPTGTVVIVAGVSDGPTGGPHLHPLVVSGPGWAHRELVSPTTGRAPYVQLFDLTATVLSLQGVEDLPDGVSGRPVRLSSSQVQGLSSYVDIDRHARRALAVGHPTFAVLCVVLSVVLLLLVLWPGGAVWPARLLAFAPVLCWLVQVVPWWRWPVVGYAAFIAVGCAVGALLLWLLARWRPRAALLAAPLVTAAVLVADQLAGAPLQTSAPFGDSPLVAGRFHGMGNIAFGVTAAALLLCAATFAARRPRKRAVLVVVAFAVVAVVVDGAPPLGDDLGGILALVPAFAVLAALVAGVRVTAARVVAIGVGAVALAAVVALADYARPAEHQTHLGRFVHDVLHGGAWRTVHRKLDAVVGSFDNPFVTITVVVAIAVALLLARRGRSEPAVVSVAVLAVVGSALNDSGIFVAAAALLAFVPAMAGARLRDTGAS